MNLKKKKLGIQKKINRNTKKIIDVNLLFFELFKFFLTRLNKITYNIHLLNSK